MTQHPKSIRLHSTLLLIFGIIWLVLAINPFDVTIWAVENILLFIGLIFIVENYANNHFSNTSYIAIFIFCILQSIGAHYTYAEVPIGFEIQKTFDLSRNHYDRFVHFCFGLLLALPIKEYYAHKIIIINPLLKIVIISFLFFGMGGFYEVLEWFYAAVSGANSNAGFLGEQGDKWDAQKDIGLAGLGAFISLIISWFFDKKSLRIR